MSSERAYITVLGRYVWAMVNSYYAVLREEDYYPDKVYIVAEERFESEVDKGKEAFEILNERYDISPEVKTIIVEDVDFISAGKKISKTIEDLKEDGCKIAIDVTPGRKPLVTAALVPAIKKGLEHIFYLEISDLEDVAKPYMEIPLGKQKLWDLLDFYREGIT
ncbi:MAG: hypothetical protein ACOCZJ_02435 [Thermoplasmatota archaeon]